MSEPEVEARGELLRARLRAGGLSEDRLRLAVHLGDAAARRALGLEAAPEEDPLELYEWAYGFVAWGQEACVRAALAAALRCEALLVARPAPAAGAERAQDVRRMLAALEEHLTRPATVGRDALARLAEEAWLSGREDWVTRAALVAATCALEAALAPAEPRTASAGPAARAVATAARVEADGALREAVAAALLPWVLEG